MRQVTFLVVAAALVAGCGQNRLVDRLPPELRAEAKATMAARKRECDALQKSFAPSRDVGGGFTVLGMGLSFRNATATGSGAQSQFLIALNNLLVACRHWQRFEDGSDAAYREAQLRAADIAQGSLAAAETKKVLDQLLTALANAKGESEGGAAIAQELARLQQELAAHPKVPDPGLDLARLDRIDQSVADLKQLLVSYLTDAKALSQGWTLRFNQRSSTPAANEIASARTSILEAFKACPKGRLIAFGYADITGSARANVILSKARADAVLEALKLDGSYPASVGGAGSTKKFGASPDDIRRVELSFACPTHS